MEIIFKAKTYKHEWVYGNLLQYPSSTVIVQFVLDEMSFISVNKKTVCLYSGESDKTGKMIFNGDLIKIGAEKDIYEVRFGHGCFMAFLNGKQCGLIGELKNCFIEVVGSIHD